MARARLEIDINARNNTGNVFTELKSKIDLVKQAVDTFSGVFRTAMDIGKEGAELDYASDKFDRLSAKIKTTSDLLMNDLRQATGGLVSDAELVQSAGDFMALGLAKTHDEVVRLTTVAGALGMDMNQLVLTLTNQTTMRFDALGVSVDGFDEKVAKLKETGMSASEAFNEAFLQQAEEQIKTLGNKADSSVASFARLETSVKNLGDTLKKQLAPPLAQAADAANMLLTNGQKIDAAFDDHNDTMVRASKSYEEYRKEMERAAEVAGKWYIDEQRAQMEGMGAAIDVAAENAGILSENEWAAARAAMDAGDGAERLKDAYDAVNPTLETAVQNAEDFAKQLEDAQKAVDDLQKQQDNWQQGVGRDVAKMLDDSEVKGFEYTQALKAIDDATGTGLYNQYRQDEALQALVDKYAAGKLSSDEFRQGIEDVAAEFDPFSGKLDTARQKVEALKTSLDGLNGTLTMTVEWRGSGPAGAPQGDRYSPTGGTSVTAYAEGGWLEPHEAVQWNERGREMLITDGGGFILNAAETKNLIESMRRMTQAGGGGITNYNLAVHTSQSANVVTNSFHAMRALSYG